MPIESRVRRCSLSLVLVGLTGCAGPEGSMDPVGPDPVGPSIQAIEVSSPAGTLMAVGRTLQLTASATDTDGNAMSGVAIDWSSSEPGILSVGASGLVEALDVGSGLVTASSGGVAGSIGLTGVLADLLGVQEALSDEFAVALRSAMSRSTVASLNALVASCNLHIASGDVAALNACLATTLAQPGGDGNDAALLAAHALIVEYAQRLIQIEG